MGKPILYHNNGSTARSVLLTAKAIGLELDNVIINTLAGEQLKPEFIKLNPQHTVPTLVDNGKVLWESHAIVKYLVAVYGKHTTLLPTDDYQLAKLDQRLHFSNSVLSNSFAKIVRPIAYENAYEFNEADVKSLFEVIDFLEIFLKDDPYFVGNNVTVADLCFSASIYAVFKLFPIPNKSQRYPKLLTWLEKISSLPYFGEEAYDALLQTQNKFFNDLKAKNKAKAQQL